MEKIYRSQKIKLLSFSLLLMLLLGGYSASAQYCVTMLGGSGCGTDEITDVEIVGTSLSNLANTCTGTTSNTLTVFPASGTTTALLTQGQVYTLSVKSNTNSIISVWIDYDNNLVYNTYEWTQVCLASTAGTANSVIIAIPFGSYSGLTGMRIRSRASGSPNAAPDGCTEFFSGETEDYTITIGAGSPCVAPPTAGTAASSATLACLGSIINLSLNGNSIGSGQTYQWQSSPDNVTWSNIAGATNSSILDSVVAASYYQCIVTCAAQSVISTSVFVNIKPANQCYCASIVNSTVDDDIGNVTIGSLNNGIGTPALNNATSINTYSDFTSLPATDLMQGSSNPITLVQINSSATFYVCFATVHIDFNQDGIFNTTDEVFPIGATNSALGGNILLGNISIPFSALLGNTRMRIVLRENGSALQTACEGYGYGETEDYIVNIISGVLCTNPPNAGNAVASSILTCDSSTVSLSLTGNSVGSGQTYQWQSSPDNLSWTNIVNATNSYASVVVTAVSYYRCEVICSGGTAVNSSSILVSLKASALCYCASGANFTVDDDIGWFELGPLVTGADTVALTNSSSVKTYTDFTYLGATPLSQSESYPIKMIQINSTASFYVCTFNAYLDYNQDGLYDSTEVIFSDTTSNVAAGNLLQGTVTIPATATIGNTGLRLVLTETNPVSPCGNYGYGETEDYLIYIDYPLGIKTNQENVSLSVTPNPASNKLLVSFNSAEADNAQLKLINLKGQLVYSETINRLSGNYSKTIDVSSFAKGIYSLQLISTKGITNKKVVIE